MSKHINVHVLRNIAQEHLIYIYWLAYKNERTLSVKGQTATSAEVLTVFYAESGVVCPTCSVKDEHAGVV